MQPDSDRLELAFLSGGIIAGTWMDSASSVGEMARACEIVPRLHTLNLDQMLIIIILDKKL